MISGTWLAGGGGGSRSGWDATMIYWSGLVRGSLWGILW